jgi:hypothetical protein
MGEVRVAGASGPHPLSFCHFSPLFDQDRKRPVMVRCEPLVLLYVAARRDSVLQQVAF